MKKIILTLLLMLSFVYTEAQNEKKYIYGNSNDCLYLYDESALNVPYVVNESLFNSFKNYKKFFTAETTPAVKELMVQLFNTQARQDKDYIPVWVIKENYLYLANIWAYSYIDKEEDFQKNARKKIEEYTSRKFDIEFNSTDTYKAAKKLMKADWVSGTFYLSTNDAENDDILPWRKIEIENGVVLNIESVDEAASMDSKRRRAPYTDEEIDNIIKKIESEKRNQHK